MTLALLITAATGAWAQTEESESFTTTTAGQKVYTGTHVKITATNLYDSGEILLYSEGQQATIETLNGETITKIVVTASKNPQNCSDVTSTSGTVEKGNPTSTIKDVNATSVVISSQYVVGISQITVYYTGGAASGPEVTLSDDKTEASFKMPQYDVTATYTLKRDLSVETQVTVGDGTDGVRYRVQKQGNTFQPVGMDQAQVMALFRVHDQIEDEDLAAVQDYTVQIYAVDIEGQPTGDAITFQNFTYAPGKYVVKAVAAEGSNYSGETEKSNVFELFQGYEVTVPAKEFITYYKDEPLYVEDEAAELYTITSVSADQAVLSEKSDAMPSNTPMLVYNKSNETKTILLIPCAEPDMAITVAPEFVGTLEATTIAASTDDQTNYAFNGKQFVWVKDALAIGANKAWLSINTGVPSARAITLVFDEATGVNEVIGVKEVNDGSWYDLNGRKLNGMPTKKGVYILNGKKVVVK